MNKIINLFNNLFGRYISIHLAPFSLIKQHFAKFLNDDIVLKRYYQSKIQELLRDQIKDSSARIKLSEEILNLIMKG